ncbi:MAG TPA: hypothetical protein VMK12_27460 [Anaeromyxobacteraceae bacterium]|nr:hypothetical protein [Anaeromyxobacteraceae bacterium]
MMRHAFIARRCLALAALRATTFSRRPARAQADGPKPVGWSDALEDRQLPAGLGPGGQHSVGSRAICRDEWKASAAQSLITLNVFRYAGDPAKAVGNGPNHEVWGLYEHDFNERYDLAKRHPENLRAPTALFDAEADQVRRLRAFDAERSIERWRQLQQPRCELPWLVPPGRNPMKEEEAMRINLSTHYKEHGIPHDLPT